MKATDIVIIIPTYNEIENIKKIIVTILNEYPFLHLLIVDDNSPDGTSKEVIKQKKKFPDNLFLEIRNKKEGIGKAYIHGFIWALNKNYNFIFQMDADFSHNPSYLKEMILCLKNESDVVIGSRYIKGINVVNWPISRILLSYIASLYVRFFLQMPIKDPTAGFAGYKAIILKNIALKKIKLSGYGFQIELKYRLFIKKYNIKEIPIIFTNRELGKSKMNTSIIGESILGVICLRIKNILNILF